MAKYVSKPVEIEASRFLNMPHEGVKFADGYYVEGKQGPVQCKLGDWIITEMDGSGYYPCANEVFCAKYLVVT